MKLEQAARQLLDCFENGLIDLNAVTALREALAEPEKHEYKHITYGAYMDKDGALQIGIVPEALAVSKQRTEEQATVSGGLCGGCAKKAADGWALYCVECWEKAEQEPVKRFTSDDIKVAFENGYAAAMSVAEISEEAEQEPVAYNPSPTCIKHIEGMPVGTPLYAAPVRTKDLTDDEIRAVWLKVIDPDGGDEVMALARAVIAADREKNK